MKTINLIPRQRLAYIPEELRVLHEYCFFLHDECTRVLVEYEKEDAHLVSVNFANQDEQLLFERYASELDVIEALNKLGYLDESRRAIINTTLMAMLADCLHHIYEALKCFEKRKFVVGFNLLRKPLLDSLIYLSWILCREDEFYESFIQSSPENLTQNRLGNIREKLFEECLSLIGLNDFIDANELNRILFSKSDEDGLYMYFQHAVHLVTVQHIKLKTAPQNFNFIFKNPLDDDVYDRLYQTLPYVLLYFSHVIISVFNKMKPMESGALTAFNIRSKIGYQAIYHDIKPNEFESLLRIFEDTSCNHCKNTVKLTQYNLIKISLTESFRCNHCHRKNYFPFSYLF